MAICVKFEQPAPEQRSTLYPVTPTLSVEAVQERLICVVDAAVTIKLPGAVGGVVSGGGEEELLQPVITRAKHRDKIMAQKKSGRTRFPRARFTWIPFG